MSASAQRTYRPRGPPGTAPPRPPSRGSARIHGAAQILGTTRSRPCLLGLLRQPAAPTPAQTLGTTGGTAPARREQLCGNRTATATDLVSLPILPGYALLDIT